MPQNPSEVRNITGVYPRPVMQNLCNDTDSLPMPYFLVPADNDRVITYPAAIGDPETILWWRSKALDGSLLVTLHEALRWGVHHRVASVLPVDGNKMLVLCGRRLLPQRITLIGYNPEYDRVCKRCERAYQKLYEGRVLGTPSGYGITKRAEQRWRERMRARGADV